jgi:hypothetical protein
MNEGGTTISANGLDEIKVERGACGLTFNLPMRLKICLNENGVSLWLHTATNIVIE